MSGPINSGLTPTEVISHFGLITLPNGMRAINSIIVNRVWCLTAFIEESLTVGTLFARHIDLEETLILPDGTEAAPSLTFENDTTTGLYRPATGGIGFTVGGADALTLDATADFAIPISSPAGQDIVIDAATSIVDFSNNTLINVAGISTNQDQYTLYSAPLTTLNATPTLLLNIPVDLNSAFLISANISVANATDALSSAAFTIIVKAKNIAGTVTLSATTTLISAIDAGLSNIAVAYGVTGANATINVTGLAATTVRWFGAAQITRRLF